MIGVIIMSHGDYCIELRKSCEMIVGHQNDITTISLREEGVDSFREKVVKTMDKFKNAYTFVIVLADIKNATPYNEAYHYILKNEINNFYLITGMNLPILAELLVMRSQTEDIKDFVEYLVDAGKKSIELSEIKINNEIDSTSDDL